MSADELGKDLERAHDWCDRQGLPKSEDLGERLAPWIDEHAQALRFAASEMERLTRERDGEREEREKVSALKRQREDEYEVALRERDEWKARAETAEEELAQVRGMHASNVDAGARVSAAFDKDGVGHPKDGVLTRALALLERLRAAEKVVEVARDARWGCDGNERAELSDALAAYDAIKEGGHEDPPPQDVAGVLPGGALRREALRGAEGRPGFPGGRHARPP